MTHFIVIAALLTALAVVAVLVPLLKGGRGRWTALLVALLVPAGTSLLYGHVSNWNWQPAPISAATNSQEKRAQDPPAIVALLGQRLRANPDDIEAWLTLGKSYLAVGEVDSAVHAFTRAYQLSGGKNA